MSHSLAILFSGQGAQKVGMGQDLYENSQAARSLYDQADSILGWPLTKASFQGPESKLITTAVCQPALFVHGLAVLAAYTEKFGSPLSFQAAAGLSLGEYTAHVAAGTFDFGTGLRLVAERGRLMQEACEQSSGSMMTLLGATPEQARAIAQAADVDVANLNCPGQIVLSGALEAMKAVPELAKAQGIRKAIPLQVAGAYHSRFMAPAAEQLYPHLLAAKALPPKVPVIANFTAASVCDPAQIRETLRDQVCGSVRWEESIRELIKLGVTRFVECGVGGVLTGLMKRIEPGAVCLPWEKWADFDAKPL